MNFFLSIITGLFLVAGSPPASSVTAGPAPFPLPLRGPGGALHPRPAPDTLLDISGTWVGKLYQNPGGVAPEFDFTMEIKHNGVFIRGTAFVRFESIWVEMAWSGHRTENGNFEIVETEILRSQKPEDLAWCMKEYTVRTEYTKEGLVLIGPWWGSSVYGPCIPGSVRLIRKVKTA